MDRASIPHHPAQTAPRERDGNRRAGHTLCGMTPPDRFVSRPAIGYAAPRVSRPEGETTLTAMDRVADPSSPVVELTAGTKIGHYVIEQRLGAGGMGVVY